MIGLKLILRPNPTKKWGISSLFGHLFIHTLIHSITQQRAHLAWASICLLKRLQGSWRRITVLHTIVSWNCLQLCDQLAFKVNKCGKKLSVLTQFVVVLSSPASQIFLEKEEDAGNTIVFAAQLGHTRLCSTENSPFG